MAFCGTRDWTKFLLTDVHYVIHIATQTREKTINIIIQKLFSKPAKVTLLKLNNVYL